MKSEFPSLLPEQFGPLQGMRILSTGTIVAEPFAAEMAAEMGAEVIHVERPDQGDLLWRTTEFPIQGPDDNPVSSAWIQERRNMLHITLDFSKPEGRGLFLRLIPHCDIWMESSKAGTYERWGLDDKTVLEANPKIIITHISGYGQDGHPDYVGRASYDVVAQAFGGMMNLAGFPDPEPPIRAVPFTGDYITALFGLWSSLAGYIYALRTGKGQVIDLAQYEAVHHILAGTMIAYHELGIVRERTGNKAGHAQPYDAFQAQDGWVIIAGIGNVFDRVCEVLELDPREAKWRKAHNEVESLEGIEFDAVLRGWVEERTVEEVVEVMNAAQVGCSPVMTAKDMAEDPHYRRRDAHIEWEDLQLGKRVRGVGIAPKFSLTPGKVWRGSVPLGYDNEQVYQGYLGLDASEIVELRDSGII